MNSPCCATNVTLQRPAAEEFDPLPAPDQVFLTGATFDTITRTEGYPFVDIELESSGIGSIDVFERRDGAPRFARTRPTILTVADVDETGAAINRIATRIQVNSDITLIRYTNTGVPPSRVNLVVKANPI